MAPTITTRPSTSAQRVAEGLRHRILTGALPAGSAVVQADVAASFAVSVTPVREALRHLASVGLVTTHPHRGATVTAVSLDEAIEVQHLRYLLEPELARRATRHMTTEQSSALVDSFSAMSTAEHSTELEDQFAAILFAAADSPRMAAIAHGLRDRGAVASHLLGEARDGGSVMTHHRFLLSAVTRGAEQRAAGLVERYHARRLRRLEERPAAVAPLFQQELAS